MKKMFFLYHLEINLIVRINHPLEEDEITYVILFSDQFSWFLLKHHFCEFIQGRFLYFLFSAKNHYFHYWRTIIDTQSINRVTKIVVKKNFQPAGKVPRNHDRSILIYIKRERDCHRDKSRNRSTWREVARVYIWSVK